MSRDNSVPFTDEELEHFTSAFRAQPTYRNGPEETIQSKDFPAMWKEMKFVRTPEELSFLKACWDKNVGEVMTLAVFLEGAKVLHEAGGIARVLGKSFDKNGDGFISVDEFEELLKMVAVVDPKLENLTFDVFVKEADSNKDGRVSVAECGNWIDNFVRGS